MIELNVEEICSVIGGNVQPGPDGFGPGEPDPKNEEHPSVEMFRQWKMRNLFYGY